MLVKDIMTKDLVTVKEEDTVDYVAKLLIEKNIGGVPVVNDENRVVGIVTESDLIYKDKKLHIPSFIRVLDGLIFLESLKKFEEEIKKIAGYKIKDIMTTPVVTLDENSTVEDAATIMIEKKINRIPIVRDGKLVGIISKSDIVRSLVKGIEGGNIVEN